VVVGGQAQGGGHGRVGIILAAVPRTISTLLATIALALLAAGCGGGSGGSTGKSAGTTSTVATAGAPLPDGCRRVQDPGAREDETHVPRPKTRLTSTNATVAIDTNCGAFTIALDVSGSPRTTSSFAALVKRGFYDRLTIHRIATDASGKPFVIQGGDPLGNGLGGPGYSVREKPPAGTRYLKYTVAMAKTASEPAGTSGSQFFVVTGADAGLSPQYAVVGKVTSGQDIVDRIASVPTGNNEQPIVPIVIERATLNGA
jgi:peptidyl-prolyl cis-trans isomerase B (cyclophilin B)